MGGGLNYSLLSEEAAQSPPHPTATAQSPSLGVRVLEAPGLHGSNEEVLRAEGLVVESITVSSAASIQIPVNVERLATSSPCGMLRSVALQHPLPHTPLALPLR
jgi:hypothetical protein